MTYNRKRVSNLKKETCLEIIKTFLCILKLEKLDNILENKEDDERWC